MAKKDSSKEEKSHPAVKADRFKQVTDAVKTTWLWLRRNWRRLAVGVAVAVVAVVAVAFLGIYGLGWQNWYTRLVSAVVPFPAAYAGNDAISYSDYYGRYRLLDREAHKSGSKVSGKELGQEAIGQLIQQSVISSYARQNNIAVTDADVEAQLQKIYSSDGGQAKVAAELQQQYGVSLGDYRQMVRERLLEQAVQTSLQNDAAAKKAAQDQAQNILKQAKNGADFDKLAARYSQDITASATGPAALVPAESTPAAVQTAAAKVADGQIVADPIAASGKVYVVKRVQSVENHIVLRIIVIPVGNLNSWLAQQMGKTKQVKLLPQIR